MKLLNTTLLAGILGAALLIFGLSVQAQNITFLDMAVLPAMQTAAPGASPFWSVQLINNNPDPAYFIFTGFNDGLGAVPNISVPAYNPTPFGNQYTLAPNTSVTLPNLFQTVISPSASNATYNSTATSTYDLYDSSAFNNVLLSGVTASNDWTLRVQSVPPSGVPEPGSLALLFGISLAGSVLFMRRRRRKN